MQRDLFLIYKNPHLASKRIIFTNKILFTIQLIQPIIEYCLLFSNTKMGGSKLDVSFVLLFVYKGTKLENLIARILEQNINAAIEYNSWEKNINLIWFIGILSREGILVNDIENLVQPYLKKIRLEIDTIISTQNDLSSYVPILQNFITLAIFQEKLSSDEEKVLFKMIKSLHEYCEQNTGHLSIHVSRIYTYLISTCVLQHHKELIPNLFSEIESLILSCRLSIDSSLAALLSNGQLEKYPFYPVSSFCFTNILTLREITDCVLGEILHGCNKLTSIFISPRFLSEESLSKLVPIDCHRFCLESGLARLILTFLLASCSSSYFKDAQTLTLVTLIL